MFYLVGDAAMPVLLLDFSWLDTSKLSHPHFKLNARTKIIGLLPGHLHFE
jgi:hypothetical protein